MLTFAQDFENLKSKISSIEGVWEEKQQGIKVFRTKGALMRWFESTGTLQFQGKPGLLNILENEVKHLLYPEEFSAPENVIPINDALFEPGPVAEAFVEVSPQEVTKTISSQFLEDEFQHSEIIMGLVAAVGTEVSRVITPLTDRLNGYGYNVIIIRVSSLLPAPRETVEYSRIRHYMTAGDNIRGSSDNHGILAYGAAKLISEHRPVVPNKTAYIINSLKHPDEVSALRKIYGQGFYMMGIHADKRRRFNFLTNDKSLTHEQANELISIDEDEKIKNGQRTRDTFHLSDFYLNLGKDDDQVKNTLTRFLELIFSQPYKNPTFDEFAMFMAFSSSARSGDLSRQVGAVISKNKQIIATGANEVPAATGGHYWAEINPDSGEVYDFPEGKDYMRDQDSNKVEQNEIIKALASSISSIEGIGQDMIQQIVAKLNSSRINDLTEFGRVVHAEMQAILSCAKEGINCSEATLYCTTFPCHNCAKHLIAAGIKRVIYVEPYAKSKALEFHSESITTDPSATGLVLFEPFIGVGARRFLDFFSMNSGAGTKLIRKTKEGSTIDWDKDSAKLRVILLPESYLEIEKSATDIFNRSLP